MRTGKYVPHAYKPFKLEPLPCDAATLGRDFRHYLWYRLGRFHGCASIYLYEALANTVRDRLMADWRYTWNKQWEPGIRRVYYMSMEFLIGRSLGNHLLNMDLQGAAAQAMFDFSEKLEEVAEDEPDAGLGNGGLGRLAACFMDSCACMGLPVMGYGIRYQYGMFRQYIENGFQKEAADLWLQNGNPWEVERIEYSQIVKFGGYTERYTDEHGQPRVRWVSNNDMVAIPFDMPVSGYRNNTVNTLRLWKAAATDEFNLAEFNAGSYSEAVQSKNQAEDISMVLYPNDSSENGKELRLRQQYFLASASIKDAIRVSMRHTEFSIDHFQDENLFQMNDTHPTIAVAELMRILIDEQDVSWDRAWRTTNACMAYTNHTLLPEALEKWPVSLFERLLPRLLEIIYEINAHFLRQVSMKWPGDSERLRRMSIIEEGPVRFVRMAWLAIVGSCSVNGVAALHSQLLRDGLFHDFYQMWPEKFNNKTNGVTPRRWVAHANPGMTALITEVVGEGWVGNLEKIAALKPLAEPGHDDFHQRWRAVRLTNKQRLAAMVEEECGVTFDPSSLFDVQVKRIHEYKRQLLNVLHIVYLYLRIKHGHLDGVVNRCVLIGGKAAPGYRMAKLIIKLINNVADVVNNDPDVDGRLKVAFLPNYRVSSMEVIAPASDLSEQISTAGKEASGTGNMKFMMNGAVTIGTYDGANIEILEAVGAENFFLFGLRADQVDSLRHEYRPWEYVDRDPDLHAVIELLRGGHFSLSEPGLFNPVIDSILSPCDPWMVLADFRSYVDAQHEVAKAWMDTERWTRMSILNTACSGFFSSDRTINEYNRDIWKLNPLPLD